MLKLTFTTGAGGPLPGLAIGGADGAKLTVPSYVWCSGPTSLTPPSDDGGNNHACGGIGDLDSGVGDGNSAQSASVAETAEAASVNIASNTLVYLHRDHLDSVSVTTNEQGNVLNRQEYDAWGKVRSGGVPQTRLNFTGQRLDDTGLLYYSARYYDPSLARFVSPCQVPG